MGFCFNVNTSWMGSDYQQTAPESKFRSLDLDNDYQCIRPKTAEMQQVHYLPA